MPDWVVSIIVAALVSGAGLAPVIFQRQRDKADWGTKLQQMATQLATDCATERTARRVLERRIDEVETYVDSLLDGIKLLIRQLEDNRLKPCWRPGERPRETAQKEVEL